MFRWIAKFVVFNHRRYYAARGIYTAGGVVRIATSIFGQRLSVGRFCVETGMYLEKVLALEVLYGGHRDYREIRRDTTPRPIPSSSSQNFTNPKCSNLDQSTFKMIIHWLYIVTLIAGMTFGEEVSVRRFIGQMATLLDLVLGLLHFQSQLNYVLNLSNWMTKEYTDAGWISEIPLLEIFKLILQ